MIPVCGTGYFLRPYWLADPGEVHADRFPLDAERIPAGTVEGEAPREHLRLEIVAPTAGEKGRHTLAAGE